MTKSGLKFLHILHTNYGLSILLRKGPWTQVLLNMDTDALLDQINKHFFYFFSIFNSVKSRLYRRVTNSTLPDIMSRSEVCQISKIRTVRKLDVFLSGHQTFNTFKNRKKHFFKIFFVVIYF